MAPMTPQNDVEVGESLPPMTEHVSQQADTHGIQHPQRLTRPGRERLAADMAS
jgi:hypothetical protein